jgi:hypothetical protein
VDFFQVVFRGKLLSGFTPEQVRTNLAALFKTDETRIGTMLAQPKWIIKTGISKEQATKIQEALRTAGVMVAVMAVDPANEAANLAAAPVASASPSTNSEAAASAAPAQFAAKPISAETVSSTGSALTASTADAPLAAKAKVAAYNPDLSAFSLAEVGAVMVTASKQSAATIASTIDLKLADVGAPVSETPKAAKREFSTAGLSLEPTAVVEKERSSFVKNVDG